MRFNSILMCTFVICSSVIGCSKDPVTQVMESLDCIETSMRQNIDQPEPLISSLDACIEKYQGVWKETHRIFSEESSESVDRSINVKGRRIRESMQNIMDMDSAIQDHLQDNPKMLSAYMERIQRIY